MSWEKRLLGVDMPDAQEIFNERKVEQQEFMTDTVERLALLEQAKQQVVEEGAGKVKPLGILNFILTPDGDIRVDCDWANTSKELGEVYGQFLYHICSGKLRDTIGNLLNQAGSVNIHNKPFIESAIEKWMAMEEAEDAEPVINPLNVFRTSMHDLREDDDE